MFSENIINLTCCIIIKMPAFRLGKGSKKTKKKSYGIFHNIAPSPPPKVMENIFFIYFIYGF